MPLTAVLGLEDVYEIVAQTQTLRAPSSSRACGSGARDPTIGTDRACNPDVGIAIETNCAVLDGRTTPVGTGILQPTAQ